MAEVSSVALCREIDFGFGKKLYMGFSLNDQHDVNIYIYIYIYNYLENIEVISGNYHSSVFQIFQFIFGDISHTLRPCS
jgi:hypothetical protein